MSLTGNEGEAGAINAEGLRRLYEAYYTPERTTLIVVGDVDPAWLRGRSRRGSATGGPRQRREDVAVTPQPDSARRRPAGTGTGTQLPHPRRAGRADLGDGRPVTPLGGGDAAAPRDQGFLQSLGADMLAARVTGHRGGDRPFMDADAAVEDYYRTARIARFAVRALDNDWRMAVGVAEQELRCALRNGFTPDELAIELEREGERLARVSRRRRPAARSPTGWSRWSAWAWCRPRPARPEDTRAYLAAIRLDAVNAAFRAAWAAPGRRVHLSHDRPIEGGEAAVAAAWAAAAPCPRSTLVIPAEAGTDEHRWPGFTDAFASLRIRVHGSRLSPGSLSASAAGRSSSDAHVAMLGGRRHMRLGARVSSPSTMMTSVTVRQAPGALRSRAVTVEEPLTLARVSLRQRLVVPTPPLIARAVATSACCCSWQLSCRCTRSLSEWPKRRTLATDDFGGADETADPARRADRGVAEPVPDPEPPLRAPLAGGERGGGAVLIRGGGGGGCGRRRRAAGRAGGFCAVAAAARLAASSKARQEKRQIDRRTAHPCPPPKAGLSSTLVRPGVSLRLPSRQVAKATAVPMQSW